MHKRIISLLLSCLLLTIPLSPVAFAAENNTSSCYIATIECPAAYTAYATENVSDFILSLNENINYSSINVGTPFAFTDANADVYYFPVICDGSIKYLFRVYPDGNSFSAAITAFLADEIESLAEYTSANNPMYLNLVDTKIVATIGSNQYVLFEYPEDMSTAGDEVETTSFCNYSVVNAKNPTNIELNLRQTRDVHKYINLNIIETQTGSGNSWCTAYCLATIIRTQTSYYTTASGIMTIAVGANPSTSTAFPWTTSDPQAMIDVANQYGLSPTVLSTTASNAVLTSEINAGRPCIAAMNRGAGRHSIVLRGYSSLGTWGIWNPWFSTYENYSMTGAYVPTGYSAADYSYIPYMHAYNFG